MSDQHVEPIERGPQAGSANPGNLIPRRHTLDGVALEPGYDEGVALQSLEAGTVLTVNTRNSRYRLVVLDGARQHVLVTGGLRFPEGTEVHVDGATSGGSAVKTGWIGIGLHLEMSIGRRHIITSRVRSITIESVPPVCPALLPL